MNTEFTLKNFRVFDSKDGGTFKFAPLTILTGCNSSGKSSVVKAISLLKSFFCSLLSNDINESRLDLDSKITRLGGFNLVRNKESKKGERIYFSYTTTPRVLGEEVLVEMWFASDKKDKLDNAWLEQFVIRKQADKRVIIDVAYKRSKNDTEGTILHIRKIDLNVILNQFYKVVYRELLAEATSNGYLSVITYNTELDDQAVKAFENRVENLKEILSRYASDQEVKSASFIVDNPYTSIYGKNKHIYTEASDHGVLLPLPILPKLKGVKKEELRDKINGIIDDYWAHNDEKLWKILKLEFKEEVLPLVISEFEKSSFDDFISYYRAKEQEGLVFKNIKKDLNTISRKWFDAEIKEMSFQDRIGHFSSLLYIVSGLVRSIPARTDWREQFGFNPQSFSSLYDTMVELSKYIDGNMLRERYISQINISSIEAYSEHRIFTDLCNYFDKLVAQSLSPRFFRDFQYIADSAIEVKRVYTLDGESQFAQLLSDYLEACRKDIWDDIKPGEFVNKWIQIFGIGDRISIEKTAEGYGILMRLHKSNEDKKGIILADEGYGVTKFIASLLNVELAILKEPMTYEVDSSNFGGSIVPYGDSKKSKLNNSARIMQILAIEEPENHLHPKFQSLLADMFLEAYNKYKIRFVIETHSEYLIRKLQTLVAKKELSADEVSLQYVYDVKSENRPKGEPHVKNIPIRPDGTLQDSFGQGFFDEADNLAMDLLTIKAMS